MNTTLDDIIDVAEDLDWKVTTDENYICFEIYSLYDKDFLHRT